MKFKLVIYLFVFFFCGAAIGLWTGQRLSPGTSTVAGCRPPSHDDIDLFYSDVLKVSYEQERRLLEIEKKYQARRDLFTRQMHLANLKLADVIEQDGYESEKIRPLVTEIHTAMGELQALSLTHLATVEAILEPGQAKLLKNNAVERLRQN